jgi:hypothetical protein
MEIIKQIIREELQKVLSTLKESDFYSSIDYNFSPKRDNPKVENPKENIIYDYDKGTVFAGDNLEVDIMNLNRYHLVEYLPKGQNEEQWNFECETVRGTTLMIDIIRRVKGGKSFWSLNFGQLYKGEEMPTLIAEFPPVEGYDNFINGVNKNLGVKIDPSKF